MSNLKEKMQNSGAYIIVEKCNDHFVASLIDNETKLKIETASAFSPVHAMWFLECKVNGDKR